MTRKTVKVNRERQRDLLGDELKSSKRESYVDESPSRVFVAPDRHELYLGNDRVDRYLEQAGLQIPLKVADLLDAYDWSEFEARYANNGRAPYAPRAMVGLILYGTMQGISSLRALEKFARADLGCLWVSGGIFPDHASIGRFIVQHEASFTHDLFKQITVSALTATKSNGRVVAGDGTVVEASCSHYGVLHEEAIRANALSKKKASDKDPHNARLRTQAELAQQAEQTYDERKKTRLSKSYATTTLVVSPVEPEAVVQPLKRKRGRTPSYKPSVLVNDKRVILAQDVNPSHEAILVPGLLDKSQQVSGEAVETLMLDGGYFCDSVLQTALDRNINLLCPSFQEVARKKAGEKPARGQFAKHAFKYDSLNDVYICPVGNSLTPGLQRKKNYKIYGTPLCKDCPQRAKCTSAKSGRTLRRLPHDEIKEAQQAVMSQPGAQAEFRQRQGMVEPVFSYLQQVQGLNRFKRRGLNRVQVEFALHTLAYNLRRAVAAQVAAEAVFCLFLLVARIFADDLRKEPAI